MTEAIELQAQLAEAQEIVSAQADTIAGLRKDLACCQTHNELLTLRTKKADAERQDHKRVDQSQHAPFSVRDICRIFGVPSRLVLDPQPAEPVKLSPETQEQIAAVMLQTGTPEQQAEALRYCGVDVPEPVKVPSKGDLLRWAIRSCGAKRNDNGAFFDESALGKLANLLAFITGHSLPRTATPRICTRITKQWHAHTAAGAATGMMCSLPRARSRCPSPWQDIVKAIYAVRAEAARRGEMFPQTSDDQVEDRAAAHRVADMIEWYATKGGAVAMKLPKWPTYSAPVAAQPSVPGYKLVPVEPTETMIVSGFESAPDQNFSPTEEWERYDAMTGCQQAAYRAEKCWKAMLEAAPTPPADGPDTDKAPTIEDRARLLVDDATKAGQVVRIDLVPRQPLAMGNLDMVVDVRPARIQQEKS